MLNNSLVLSVDPGSDISGVCLIRAGKIEYGEDVPNSALFSHIQAAGHAVVVVEDVKPYSLSLSQQIIDTCKFIGALQWRLEDASIPHELISRYAVKRWCFDKFQEVVIPLIEKKIQYRKLINKDGAHRKPSFAFVDDRMVAACMRAHWGLVKPKPGKKHPLGLKTHSWQALGLATYFISSESTLTPL